MSQFGNVNSNQYYMDGPIPGGPIRSVQNPNWMNVGGQMSTQSTGNYYGLSQSMNTTRPAPTPQPSPPDLTYGRMVNAEQEIVANEVPMDGNYGVFLTRDRSRVFVKTWGHDGLIHTDTYNLVIPEEVAAQQAEQDPFNIIMKKLDAIQRSVDPEKYTELSKPVTEGVAPKFSNGGV